MADRSPGIALPSSKSSRSEISVSPCHLGINLDLLPVDSLKINIRPILTLYISPLHSVYLKKSNSHFINYKNVFKIYHKLCTSVMTLLLRKSRSYLLKSWANRLPIVCYTIENESLWANSWLYKVLSTKYFLEIPVHTHLESHHQIYQGTLGLYRFQRHSKHIYNIILVDKSRDIKTNNQSSENSKFIRIIQD